MKITGYKITCVFLALLILGVGVLAYHELYAQDSPEIYEITITHSKFLSKEKIVIRYRKVDWKILSITLNGREVPESEFSKYESDLHGALDAEILHDVMPRVFKLEERLDSPDIPDSVKLAELRDVLKTLRPMKSDHAETYAGVLETRQWRIFRPYFKKDVRAALKKHGFEPPLGFVELAMGSEFCRVDDVELPQVLADEIKNIFADYRGVTLRNGEEVIFRYDGKGPAIRRSIPSED
jgi:hypothetical protein